MFYSWPLVKFLMTVALKNTLHFVVISLGKIGFAISNVIWSDVANLVTRRTASQYTPRSILDQAGFLVPE